MIGELRLLRGNGDKNGGDCCFFGIIRSVGNVNFLVIIIIVFCYLVIKSILCLRIS